MTQRHKGFTLVELMTAMAFISVLLLAIAMTAIQSGRLYNRGIVLSSVNQAGRSIGDMVRRDFLQAAYQPDFAVIAVREGEYSSGRFCTGQYSYLWNDPRVLDRASDASVLSNRAVVRDAESNLVNFIRVSDSAGALCQASPTGAYPMTIPTGSAVTTLLRTQAAEGDVVLAVHQFSIDPLTNSQSREGLYRVRFTIGTSALKELNTARQTCKPPADDAANTEFCAINNFEMIVRTNG